MNSSVSYILYCRVDFGSGPRFDIKRCILGVIGAATNLFLPGAGFVTENAASLGLQHTLKLCNCKKKHKQLPVHTAGVCAFNLLIGHCPAVVVRKVANVS